MTEPEVSAYDREHVGDVLVRGSHWTAQFWRLYSKSDLEHRVRLTSAFPDHVAVYEAWHDNRPIPPAPSVLEALLDRELAREVPPGRRPVAREESDECCCWVGTMDQLTQFQVRCGAHSTWCPVYRESGDPVDRKYDIRLREEQEAARCKCVCLCVVNLSPPSGWIPGLCRHCASESMRDSRSRHGVK